jgi:tetratricopeptide (TPR) repeat protein
MRQVIRASSQSMTSVRPSKPVQRLPSYAAAVLFPRAFALHQQGRLADAESIYRQIIAAEPAHFDSLHLLGVILHQRGDHAAAAKQIGRALKIDPGSAVALNNRGNALLALKQYEEALASYDRALALQPDYADALCNRGAALHELGRYDEALASCEMSIAAEPAAAEAYSNRGNTLKELHRWGDAVASCDQALALQPDFASGHLNRANALRELKRFEEALASYDRAIAQRPDYAEAFANRGVALQDLKRLDEALASFRRAIAIEPDYAEAHYQEAMCRLLIGDFERGWQKHEWRWQSRQLKGSRRQLRQPLWLGTDEIAGKTILLHAEQGFGDAIQFARYAPLVAARGARVVFEVQKPLRELMQSLPGIAHIVSQGDRLPPFDIHCPLLSLPLATGTMPSVTPYLRAPADAVAAWNERLVSSRRPRIGIAWSGSPTHKNDHNRSIALESFLSCLTGVEAAVLSLQPDVRGSDAAVLQERGDIAHFGGALQSFADTAALIANLDLVIAVDTAVAHLAGALAKPTWILLPFIPDWRWLLDRDGSPWYPTMRLFRQDESRRWDSVLPRVRSALCDHTRLRPMDLEYNRSAV